MTSPIIWNPVGLAELQHNPFLIKDILEKAERVAEAAREAAPKKTGAGAKSIRAEVVSDEGLSNIRVGWDVDHYYMKFHELGSKYLPARPFLVPALNRYL